MLPTAGSSNQGSSNGGKIGDMISHWLRRAAYSEHPRLPVRESLERVFANSEAQMGAFFARLFSRAMYITSLQADFYRLSQDLLPRHNLQRSGSSSVSSSSRCVTSADASRSLGTNLVVLYQPDCADFAQRGYVVYPGLLALSWICEVLIEGRGRFRTIADLPSSLVESALELEQQQQQQALSAAADYILVQMIKASQPTPTVQTGARPAPRMPPPPAPSGEGWRALNEFLWTHPEARDLVYGEAALSSCYEALTSKVGMQAREKIQRQQQQASAAATPLASRCTLDHVLFAGYIYFAFRAESAGLDRQVAEAFPEQFASPPSLTAARASRSPLLGARLYALVLDFLNGNLVYSDWAVLRRLQEHCPQLITLADEVAEDVRACVLRMNGVRVSETREREWNRRREGVDIVQYLLAATQSLQSSVSLYQDVRHEIVAHTSTTGFLSHRTRWIYRATREIAFTRFVRGLMRGFESIEQTYLGTWLKEELRLPEGAPRPSLYDITYRENEAGKNSALAQYFEDCDREFVVLRFEEEVRLYEVELTFEVLCRRYALELDALPNAAPAPSSSFTSTTAAAVAAEEADSLHSRRPPSSESNYPSSRAFFLGADHDGPYLVMRRHCHELLKRAMLVEAMCAPAKRACKSMPLFPLLLGRFYLATSAAAAAAEEERAGLANDPRWLLRPDASRDVDLDQFSLQCFVDILSHWLRLPRQDLRFHTNASSTTATTRGVRGVPRAGEDFFLCLRFVNRLADVLARGSPDRAAFPNAACMNAVREYLAFLEPRTLRADHALRLRAALEGADARTREANADLLMLLDALSFAYPLPAAPSSPSRGGGGAGGQLAKHSYPLRYTPELARELERRGALETSPLTLVHESARAPLMNWLVYAPLLNNEVDPRLAYELLTTTGGGLCAPAMRRLSESEFEKPLYAASRDAGDTKPLEEFIEYYQRVFVLAYPRLDGQGRLASAFARGEEPMHALVELMQRVEARVSPRWMRPALLSMRIDVDSLMARRDPTKCLCQSRDSMLPVSAYLDRPAPQQSSGAAPGGDSAPAWNAGAPIVMLFFETSFAIISPRLTTTAAAPTVSAATSTASSSAVAAAAAAAAAASTASASDATSVPLDEHPPPGEFFQRRGGSNACNLALDLLARYRHYVQMPRLKEMNERISHVSYQAYLNECMALERRRARERLGIIKTKQQPSQQGESMQIEDDQPPPRGGGGSGGYDDDDAASSRKRKSPSASDGASGEYASEFVRQFDKMVAQTASGRAITDVVFVDKDMPIHMHGSFLSDSLRNVMHEMFTRHRKRPRGTEPSSASKEESLVSAPPPTTGITRWKAYQPPVSASSGKTATM